MSTQVVNPAVLPPLQNALATAYWYKPDLRGFLRSATGLPELVSRYDWNDPKVTKRMIVRDFVTTLADEPHLYQRQLIALLLATPDIDPSHLKQLDDGPRLYAAAENALAALRPLVEPYKTHQDAAARAATQRDVARQAAAAGIQRAADMDLLKAEFVALHSLDPQPRGYAFEKFLTRLFDVHDIDVKGSFARHGEQIDGAFEFDGTDYLLEAKWEKKLTSNPDISVLRVKVQGRLDNTLGLFVSVTGFQDSVTELSGRGGRETVLLMDGQDIMMVVDQRIDLTSLLHRKKQHAARTGEILLRAVDILNG